MHTMMSYDMKEQRGVNSLRFVRAIRIKFTSQLPKMLPMLEQAISEEFIKEVVKFKTVDSKLDRMTPNWKHRLIRRRDVSGPAPFNDNQTGG